MRVFLAFLFVPIILLGSIGQVSALKGSAKVHRRSVVHTLKTGALIQKRDTISTGVDSRVQIILNDKTRVTIGENSQYSFLDFSYQSKRASMVEMKAEKGFFRVVTGKIGKIAPRRFKVRTRSAIIGVRGTDFYAFVKRNFEKIVCLAGRISVQTAAKTYDLRAGQMIILQNGKWTRGIASTNTIGIPEKGVVNSTQESQSLYFQNETGKSGGYATHHLWH